MPDSIDTLINTKDLAGYAPSNSATALNEFSGQRAILTPSFSQIIVPSSSSSEIVSSQHESESEGTISVETLRGPHRLNIAISAGVFVSWIALMTTVALEEGSVLQFAAVTAIPFIAHVICMCLSAYSCGGAEEL